MKYSVAIAKATEFSEERKEPVRIAKANKKEDYCLLFTGNKIPPRHTVIEIIDKRDL